MDGVGTSFTASPRMMWVRGKLGNRREIPFSGHFLPVSVPSPAPLLSTLHKMTFIDRVFLLCKAEFSPSKISYIPHFATIFFKDFIPRWAPLGLDRD